MTPPDHGSDSTSIWFCRLFEFSFETTNTIGWANTKSKFSQTKVYESSAKNKVESLPQEYGGFLTIGGANTMNINVYEPNASDYQGKIYYQEADGNGNGLGSSFLLAEVSKSKGVKSTLSTFWTSWDSSSFTDNTMYTQNGTKVIQHDGNVSVKVGMRVTKVSGSSEIPDDTYVTQINATAVSDKGQKPTNLKGGGKDDFAQAGGDALDKPEFIFDEIILAVLIALLAGLEIILSKSMFSFIITFPINFASFIPLSDKGRSKSCIFDTSQDDLACLMKVIFFKTNIIYFLKK